mmetsp:Transcript_83201/g.146986  ORF Transcript_83201/g.146986 Transcript_83201/m.146986 type:complete len:218 (+) Transcript_83201:921-1574(+)
MRTSSTRAQTKDFNVCTIEFDKVLKAATYRMMRDIFKTRTSRVMRTILRVLSPVKSLKPLRIFEDSLAWTATSKTEINTMIESKMFHVQSVEVHFKKSHPSEVARISNSMRNRLVKVNPTDDETRSFATTSPASAAEMSACTSMPINTALLKMQNPKKISKPGWTTLRFTADLNLAIMLGGFWNSTVCLCSDSLLAANICSASDATETCLNCSSSWV